MINGLFLLHKTEGMTSHTAVSRARRLFGGVKGGHTGTLDPMATGVLPVLLGRAVKASEYMIEGDKHYLATLRLGITTDTEDITGTVLTQTPNLPKEEEVREAVKTFVGEILQTPPMYSAIKIGGKKLMDLAREGKTVEREARPVTIYAIEVEKINDQDYRLDVKCSKGTYIRTLCADIGAALGCGGTMATLCRMEAAGFSLDQTHTLEELEAMTEEQRMAALIPVEALFQEHPRVSVSPFYARLAHNGQPLFQKKLGVSFPVGTRIRLCDENGFFALGEVVPELPEQIKPIKFFVI